MSQKGLIGAWRFQEQMVNGTDLLDGWDFQVTWSPTNITVNSAVQFTSTLAGGYLSIAGIITSGKTYTAHMIGSISVGGINIKDGAGTNKVLTGTFDEIFTYDSAGTTFNFQLTDNAAVAIFSKITLVETLISDLTPHGNLMQVYGATFTTDRKGRADSALSFDGVDDWSRIDDADLFDITEEITVAQWVKFPATSAGQYLSKDTSWAFVMNDDFTIRFRIFSPDPGWNDSGDSTLTYNDSQWHHVAGVYDGTTVFIYIDGAVVNSTVNSATDKSINVSARNTYVSSYGTTGVASGFKETIIDSLKIFDRALSPSEMLAEYNTYQPDGALNTGSLQKGLVAHFPLRSEYNKVGDELVTNGDMELDSNWTDSSTFGAPDDNSRSAVQAHNGTYSRHVDAGTSDYIGARSDAISMSVGRSYRGRLWMWYVAGGAPLASRIDDDPNAPNGTADATFPFTSDSGVWQESEAIFNAVNATAYLWLRPGSFSDGYYDDASVKPLLSADITPQGNHAEVWGADVQSEYTDFDGVDGYLDLGSDKPSDLTGDVTFSAWINATGWGEGNYGRIISNGRFIVHTYSNGSITVFSAGITAATSAIGALSLSTWHHVLATRTSAGITNIYIDGSLSGSADQSSGTPVAGTTNTLIGNRAAGDRTFNGYIDDIKIYNRALSATEVLALYNKGRN